LSGEPDIAVSQLRSYASEGGQILFGTDIGHAHSGRVGPGMDADLVVLRSDPSADVTALARIVFTIREGQFVFGKP
jgi:hypothetical protein